MGRITNIQSTLESERAVGASAIPSYSRFIALRPTALYVTFTSHHRNDTFTLHFKNFRCISVGELIPIFGMITGIIIPLAVFFWQYLEGKERRETILEISKTIDDPDRLDELLKMLDERKEEPTDYRRGGVITTFVGSGYLYPRVIYIW